MISPSERAACDAIEAVLWEHRAEIEGLTIVRVTPQNRTWLTKAEPHHRWAVTLKEGWYFAYGQTVEEAFDLALLRVRSP